MKLRLLTMALLPCLTGCSTLFESQEAAPVVSLEARQPITKGHHTVLPGETLYAIAWEYGHDYRDLAVANHIAPPYRIYPGQKIALNGQVKIQKRKPQQNARQTIVATPSTSVAPVLKQQPAKTVAAITPSLSGWQWPAKGKIVKSFSTKENAFNKGIDIAGSLGTPVLAAQSGKVVYSGGGLRGYGQLIIVKHNEAFLSAYAHNHRLYVKEGDTIKQGQAIAEMGQTDTDQVKLHFEIRQNGKPVNPILFLPKIT